MSRVIETFEQTVLRYDKIHWLHELKTQLRKTRQLIIKQEQHIMPHVPALISQEQFVKAQLIIQHKDQIFNILQIEPQIRIFKYLDINKESLFLTVFYLAQEK